MSDVEIRLGGGTHHLRPTFGAMREIEARTNSSCATLLQMLAKREMHLSEMAMIVYHGMVEAGEKPTDYEAIAKRLFEAGAGSEDVQNAIAQYLIELLYAPDSARKKAVGEWWALNAEITSLMFAGRPTASDGDPETSTPPLPENSGTPSKPSVKNPRP